MPAFALSAHDMTCSQHPAAHKPRALYTATHTVKTTVAKVWKLSCETRKLSAPLLFPLSALKDCADARRAHPPLPCLWFINEHG